MEGIVNAIIYKMEGIVNVIIYRMEGIVNVWGLNSVKK